MPGPPPLTGWRDVADRGLTSLVSLFKGATGLGDQGPAGPTLTNAAALLAAMVPLTAPAREALGMSEAARAARAAEMGMTRDVYHGTGRDIIAFDPTQATRHYGGKGIHVAASPNLANVYAEQWGAGGQVLPLKIPSDLKLATEGDYRNMLSTVWGEIEDGKLPPTTDAHSEIARRLQEQGFDGVQYQHEPVWGKKDGRLIPPDPNMDRTAIAIFDPANIRSRFAAFDPSKKDSANILASLVGGVGLASLMRPSARDDAQGGR